MSSSIRNNTHVVRIKAINGLLFLTYDDSFTTEANGGFLSSNGVTHVLSIVNNSSNEQAKLMKSDIEDIQRKQITIKQTPIPDILSSLNEASKWIENALSPPSRKQQQQQQDSNQVLIRAEGDSDSVPANAILIGFLMRYLRTTFSMGLRLAQESIPCIAVDNNMERQLRIWEFCRYNIYQIDPQSRVSSPRPSVTEHWMPGSYPLSPIAAGSAGPSNSEDDNSWAPGSGSGLHKPAYSAWRKECDALMAVERSRALSKMAALMAQKRGVDSARDQDEPLNDRDEDGPQGCAKDLLSRKSSKEAQWARVDEMEQSWNERLLSGAVLA